MQHHEFICYGYTVHQASTSPKLLLCNLWTCHHTGTLTCSIWAENCCFLNDYTMFCHFLGTENVVNACLRHNVQRLIFTSTVDVVVGWEEKENIDESVTPPEKLLFKAYGESKQKAERIVNLAHQLGKNSTGTSALYYWCSSGITFTSSYADGFQSSVSKWCHQFYLCMTNQFT